MTSREMLLSFRSTHSTLDLLTSVAAHAFSARDCASAVHWQLVDSPDFQPELVTRGYEELCVLVASQTD